jgi:POTRA domain, FtsQ-type
VKSFRPRRREQRSAGFDPRWLREARVLLPDRGPQRPPGRSPEPAGRGGPVVPASGGRHGRWRVLAVLLAVLEVAALVALVAGPAFRVRHVIIHGAHRLPAQQVVHVAGLDSPGSVFSVDGSGIRRRLQATSWVEGAMVSAQLPDQVVITIQEWEPVAVYHPTHGGAVYLNDQGSALGLAGADQASLLRIDGPASSAGPGRPMLDSRLLVALVNIQRGLPGLIRQPVVAFRFDRCWDLTMVAGRGWRALFGRMLTAGDYASLESKLAALRALSPYVDFASPATYVNLMNPQEPAVGHGQDQAPAPTPTPIAHPSGSPSSGGAAGPHLTPSPSPPALPGDSPSPSGPTVQPTASPCA